MAFVQHEFEAFVRRVHRRFVAVRIVEAAGIGLLGGCALAAPLVAILLWRGQPAIGFSLGAICTGAVVGLIGGIWARPGILRAALEADRQLDLADLLSSAWTVRSSAADANWAAALIAAADQHARGALPSQVILNRLGARAWGGVGLATGLLVVVSLLPVFAASTQANEGPAPVNQMLLADNHDHPSLTASSSVRRTAAQQEPDEMRPSPPSSDSSDGQPPSHQNPPGHSQAATDQNRASADQSGRGTGSARSDHPRETKLDTSHSSTTADGGSSGVTQGSGAGQSVPQAQGHGTNVQSAAGTPAADSNAPPWQSPNWSVQVKRATQQLDNGSIPDAYRDVVRRYFQIK